jgi:hypothetical protein
LAKHAFEGQRILLPFRANRSPAAFFQAEPRAFRARKTMFHVKTDFHAGTGDKGAPGLPCQEAARIISTAKKGIWRPCGEYGNI